MVWSLALASIPGEAHAGGLAGVFNNFVASLANFPWLVQAFAYIVGTAFGVWGLLSLKEHVDNPMQTKLRKPILIFLAGGGLLALPMVAEAVYETMGGGVGVISNSAYFTGHGSWSSAPTGSMSLDEVLVALMQDLVPGVGMLVKAFAYIFGFIFLVVGIIRLTKVQQEGPRGPSGMGTLTTFIVAGALLSLGSMMGSFTDSLFGTNEMFTYASLSFSGVSAAAQGHIELATEAVLFFLVMVGWISFLRGWFILKAVADGGGQNVSLTSGMTHIIGGALAVNLGPLLNAVQSTLGLTSGIVFN